MDTEAYGLVIDLMSQAHDYGEAVAYKLELFISVSSGLIVMAYFAPDRLKVGLTVLVLGLYVVFTLHTATNIIADRQLSSATIAEASLIAKQANLTSQSLTYRLNPESDFGSGLPALLFYAGLFLGTLGFVSFTAYRTYQGSSDAGDADND